MELNAIPKIANGTFTLTWPDGEKHRTFRIRTQSDRATFAPGKRVIGMMTGTDNETSYTNFGFVNNNSIDVWRTIPHNPRRANVWLEGKLLRYIDGLLSLSLYGERSPFYAKGYRLLAEERCIRCNRKLTNPESIRTKMGPECGLRIRSAGPIAAQSTFENWGADAR